MRSFEKELIALHKIYHGLETESATKVTTMWNFVSSMEVIVFHKYNQLEMFIKVIGNGLELSLDLIKLFIAFLFLKEERY